MASSRRSHRRRAASCWSASSALSFQLPPRRHAFAVARQPSCHRSRPFPQVAVHVVQAPRIGLLRADRRIVARGVARVPAVVAELRSASSPNEYFVVVPARAAYSHSASRRQADHLRRLDQLCRPASARSPCAQNCLRLVERQHLDRVPLALPAAGIAAHHRFPQVLRHFVLGDRKRGQRHFGRL